MSKKGPKFDALEAVKRRQAGESTEPQEEQSSQEAKRIRFKNPAYLQTTVYLKRGTHKALKIALAQEEKGFADLVEELIEQWLQSRNR